MANTRNRNFDMSKCAAYETSSIRSLACGGDVFELPKNLSPFLGTSCPEKAAAIFADFVYLSKTHAFTSTNAANCSTKLPA